MRFVKTKIQSPLWILVQFGLIWFVGNSLARAKPSLKIRDHNDDDNIYRTLCFAAATPASIFFLQSPWISKIFSVGIKNVPVTGTGKFFIHAPCYNFYKFTSTPRKFSIIIYLSYL